MRWLVLSAALLAASPAVAQSRANLAAFAGLTPVASLATTAPGRSALAANLRITGAIQTGAATPPLLLPFAFQEEQALRDAFITGADLGGLADGLGTRLGAAWRAHADYSAPKTFTSLAPAVARLISTTLDVEESDSQAAKYLFANRTTDGTTPVSAEAAALLARAGGVPDVYGRAYGLPAGAPGADPFGDSRAFQVRRDLRQYRGLDYFGRPADSVAYLRGPVQNLARSPSYPSGHTAYGTAGALVLGFLVPERFPELIARAADYGTDRIVLGAHYAMDVIAGRTLAYYDTARLLANDPDYVGRTLRHGTGVADYPAALAAARVAARAVLERACGATLAVCAADDAGRLRDADADAALVAATLTYGLPVVHPATAHGREDVATRAPEAGLLLTAPFPWLTLEAADRILSETEGPGGGFLDDGSAFGLYSRLDLNAAGRRALAARPAPR